MPEPEPAPVADPLGLSRPYAPPTLRDRAAGALTDLGISPRAAVVGGLLALVALLAWWWLRAPAPIAAEAEVPLAPAATVPGPTTAAEAAPVVAHAAGAVRRPGLYELPAGSRVADLVTAAGGARPGADLDRLNLAAPVADGVQVYVPRRGEAAPVADVGASGDAPAAPVDVNTAGIEELDTLPGVGPATATAIIEHREAHGPFATVDDLVDVSGIGDATLAELRDLVTV